MSSYDLPDLAAAAAISISFGATGQFGSSFLHLAMVPCGQPQSHGLEFSTLSARKRCAPVSPANADSAPISFSRIQSLGISPLPVSATLAAPRDDDDDESPPPPPPVIGNLFP